MDQNTARVLGLISVLSGIIPMLFGIINWRGARWNQRMLLKLVIAALITELLAYMIVVITQGNNLFVFHIFTVIEFIFLTLIYKKELSSLIRPKYFNGLMIIFTIYSVFNSIFIETLTQFNGYARAVSAILIIIFNLLYFYKTLKELKVQHLEKEPMFWLSIGLLIYFSASFFIFIFSNYIQPSVKLSFTFWGIHAILNISQYLFYSIALWIKAPKTA